MTSRRAAIGSAVHFLAAPGLTVGLVPWLLTRWQQGSPAWWWGVRGAGALAVAAGAGVLAAEFARFAREGDGTPAPVAPTRALVTGGLYAWVRNPMYVAATSAIIGQGLLLSRPLLLAYAAVFAAVVFAFVRGYEEPTLAEAFGDEYERYRASVPGWWPRRARYTR